MKSPEQLEFIKADLKKAAESRSYGAMLSYLRREWPGEKVSDWQPLLDKICKN